MSYVGRGGEKMAWALGHFGLDVTGLVCCDLGSHVGGFVDALLQAGAARVHSVDTSYGTLAWTLRNDPRVVVLERTNALHVALGEPVDLVSSDVGWTPQRKVLPVAATLLAPGGRILSLVKPQYEAAKEEIVPGEGRVKPEAVARILGAVTAEAGRLGAPVQGPVETPFLGGKGRNPEFFMLIGPLPGEPLPTASA
jgi:23S rRNA (cytidine1920-2'-O)/16S rRNA (cytidine1409-2'-O)-methyltransferase